MKLKNNTHQYSDKFLKSMVKWIAKFIGCKIRDIKLVEFGTRSDPYYNGHCYGSRGKVRMVACHDNDRSEFNAYPSNGYYYPGKTKIKSYWSPEVNDRLEAFVSITAHELTHLKNYGTKFYLCEARTCKSSRDIMPVFREQREQLICEWEGDLVTT